MNGKDSRSRNLNLPEYIARGSRVAQIFNSSLSLSFFFIPFNLPHGREFKCAQIVNTWDNEEFSRLCVDGQLWSFIKICEIKKKKKKEMRAIRRRETSKHFATRKLYKIPHLLVPFAWRIFARSVTPFFHIEIQVAKARKKKKKKKNSHSTCFSISPFLQ